MSITLNQKKLGAFPSNIVQNPKKNGLYLDITTQSGKENIDPLMFTINETNNNSAMVDDTPKAESERLYAWIMMLKRKKVRERSMSL